MNTNTMTAPRPMMHDIMPPYAKALPKAAAPTTPQPSVVAPAAVELAADIPVRQPDQPASDAPAAVETVQPQPTQVHPASPVVANQHHLSMPPIRRPGISWAAVSLAIVVAMVLGVAAFIAFRSANA